MCPGSPLTCSVFKKRKRSERRQGKSSELRILAVLLGVTSFTRRDDLRPMTEQRFRRHLRLPTQAPRALSTWCEAGEPSYTQVSIDSHGHLTSRQRPGQTKRAEDKEPRPASDVERHSFKHRGKREQRNLLPPVLLPGWILMWRKECVAYIR